MVDAPPLSREARKAQTREAIVAAAMKLFAEHGIEATSLDRIANEVGLTKGAIYSTFASKDDLVEAVALATTVTVDPDVLLDPNVPLREGLRKVARELMAVRKRMAKELIVLDAEFFLYERRHRSWGKRVQAERQAEFSKFAAKLDAATRARDERLPVPAEEWVYAIAALAQGIVLQMERDPKTFTTETVMSLFAALAD